VAAKWSQRLGSTTSRPSKARWNNAEVAEANSISGQKKVKGAIELVTNAKERVSDLLTRAAKMTWRLFLAREGFDQLDEIARPILSIRIHDHHGIRGFGFKDMAKGQPQWRAGCPRFG